MINRLPMYPVLSKKMIFIPDTVSNLIIDASSLLYPLN